MTTDHEEPDPQKFNRAIYDQIGEAIQKHEWAKAKELILQIRNGEEENA